MMRYQKILFCLLFAILVCGVDFSRAAEAKKQQPLPNTGMKAEGTRFDINDFEYKSESRRDPFEAVALNQMVKTRTSAATVKSRKEENQLAYELESLKLVGVVKSDKGMMAMMEDSQGRGVFFKKGDQLNNKIGMWVADVSSSDVVFAYKLKGEIRKVVVDLPNKK